MAGRLARTVAAVTVVLVAAGCTDAAQPSRGADTPTARPSPASLAHRTQTALDAEQRRHRMADDIMLGREQAIAGKDERAWLADVDPHDRELVRRQRRLFENLVQLPLRTFTLRALDATWPSEFATRRFRRTAYIPYVEQQLQLRGFDAEPVTTTYGVTLAPVGGRWRIVSDDDVADQEPARARDSPWDLTRIVVRRSPHALGIFDRTSVASAARLLAWTEQSLRIVDASVPRRWRGNVVLYAMSSPALLRRMGTRFLDRAAIAFPVVDNSDRPTHRVSTRVMVNPEFLPRNEFQGTYLLSHEITHVALAATSPWTPAWVQEGLADYVATRGADPSRWAPGRLSVTRAGRGVSSLPRSTFFGDADPAFEYDLSLAACARLADRFGEPRLWAFLDRLADAGRADGDPEAHVDEVLGAMFGLDERRLAREAARLLVRRAG